MIPQFEVLASEEKELMYEAIPLVTILIACADGEMDHQEREWAEKVTKIRSYAFHESLQAYYLKVGENYSAKLDELLASLPKETATRTAAISAQLAGLNAPLTKLEPTFAQRFHKSLLSFAKHVAKASGGFLGIGSISKAEEDLMELKMITPIELEATDDEEG